MARLLAGALLCATLASVSSFAVAVDPADAVLGIYKLTDAQAGSFNATDGKMSDFWKDWTGKDYIDMNTTNNSYPGRDSWTGADDAHITIKAGCTDAGLFLYAEVTDNVWVDPVSGGGSWAYDAVDLYLDSKSSEAIKAVGDAGMVNAAYGWALTFTTQQINVWMGSTSLPTSFMYNFYDETYWDWTYNTVEFATAATTYNGLTMEVVKVDDTHKSQEWFIPWSQVGVGGVSGDKAAGTRFGFSGGYNDMDGSDGATKCLRWKQYDPFAGATTGLDSWGDMELDAAIKAAAVGVKHNRAGKNAQVLRGVTSVQYFTLNGQRIPSLSSQYVKNNSVVVERKVLADGNVVSRRIDLGR